MEKHMCAALVVVLGVVLCGEARSQDCVDAALVDQAGTLQVSMDEFQNLTGLLQEDLSIARSVNPEGGVLFYGGLHLGLQMLEDRSRCVRPQPDAVDVEDQTKDPRSGFRSLRLGIFGGRYWLEHGLGISGVVVVSADSIDVGQQTTEDATAQGLVAVMGHWDQWLTLGIGAAGFATSVNEQAVKVPEGERRSRTFVRLGAPFLHLTTDFSLPSAAGEDIDVSVDDVPVWTLGEHALAVSGRWRWLGGPEHHLGAGVSWSVISAESLFEAHTGRLHHANARLEWSLTDAVEPARRYKGALDAAVFAEGSVVDSSRLEVVMGERGVLGGKAGAWGGVGWDEIHVRLGLYAAINHHRTLEFQPQALGHPEVGMMTWIRLGSVSGEAREPR